MIMQDNIIDIAIKDPIIKTFVFDKDGTIVMHGRVVRQADKAMAELVDMGKNVVIITNSGATENLNSISLKHRSNIRKGIHYTRIFSSGDVLQKEFTKPAYADKKFLVLGELKDENIFVNHDQFVISRNDDDFINIYNQGGIDYFFIGFPLKDGKRCLEVEDFTQLSGFIARTKTPIFAGYTDKGAVDRYGNYYILQGDILEEIMAQQEQLFGKRMPELITTFGKPHTKPFLDLLYENIPDFNPQESIMIGDNPDTDITFGKEMNMKTAYIATYKYDKLPNADYCLKSVAGSRYEDEDTNMGRQGKQKYSAKQRNR